ncbi:MAG: DUF1049 domain-containing protein [Verrucomicrobia bacterium]|nr:DUF1049 domain-containing protein [Verrucomicrobiota bacterium]
MRSAKFKLVVILVLILFLTIVVLQNTAAVETKILFATVTMPRAFLLFLAALLGFGLGLLTSLLIVRRRKG